MSEWKRPTAKILLYSFFPRPLGSTVRGLYITSQHRFISERNNRHLHDLKPPSRPISPSGLEKAIQSRQIGSFFLKECFIRIMQPPNSLCPDPALYSREVQSHKSMYPDDYITLPGIYFPCQCPFIRRREKLAAYHAEVCRVWGSPCLYKKL